MTKRAAAANAKNRMKALDVHLSASDEDEVSSVDFSSEESGSDGSSGVESVSVKAESESESESQVEIQTDLGNSAKVSRLESIGFDDFEDFTVIRKANEDSNGEYISEIIIKNSNGGSRIVSASNSVTESRGGKESGRVVELKELDLQSQDFQGIIGKYLQIWIKTLDLNVFEDDGKFAIDLYKTGEKFKCPFSACSKEFANNNGLVYHLTKANHSLIKVLEGISDLVEENDQNILQTLINSDSWPIKARGMYLRFEGKKKIHDLEVGFDNKEENISKNQSSHRKTESKMDFSPFPDKLLVKKNFTNMDNSRIPSRSENEFKVLSDMDAQVYYPEPSDLNIKLNKSSHCIKPLEAFHQDQELKKGSKQSYRNRWILNTGVSIFGLDYCPLPSNSPVQYLAIGGYKNTHENHVLGQPQFEDFPEDPRMAQMIQIWEINGRNPPKMVMGVAHRYGSVYDLKWYPFVASTSGDKNLVDRLGFLAVSFGDGSCRVFSVPNPHSIRNHFPEFSQHPILVVSCESRFEVALPGTLLWKLDWAGSETLVNGTTDGRVVVWNIEPYLHGETSRDPEPSSIYFAHDCAIRKIQGCLLSNLFFITSGNDGRFLVHDIRQPSITGQIHRTVMTGICWSGSRLICSDRENCVKLCQLEEGSSTNEHCMSDAFAQIKSLSLMRHQSCIWDLEGSPNTPFVASSSSTLMIGNSNRSKRHQSPVVLFLYSLTYDNVNNVLEFHDQEEIPEKPLSKISTGWNLSQPEMSIQKVCWNKNMGHEFELASGGRLGFVRLETCVKNQQ